MHFRRGLSSVFLVALSSCAGFHSTGGSLGENLDAAARHARATAAGFRLGASAQCSPAEGEPAFAPCAGEPSLVFMNEDGGVVATARLKSSLSGALPVGDYVLAVAFEGMTLGLESRVGLLHLEKGSRELGRLELRFVELPPGSFQDQALAAQRIARSINLTAVDFLSSPGRGLLLVDAVLREPSP